MPNSCEVTKHHRSSTTQTLLRQPEMMPPTPTYDVNAKWDACQDLMLRRVAYSTAAGAAAALLLFRSPATRWASIAFGAGIGIGSAYTECSQKFERSSAKLVSPKTSGTPASQDGQE